MADITHRILADVNDLKNKLAQSEAAYQKLNEKVRETARESKERSKSIQLGFQEEGAGLIRTIAGYVSLEKAIGFVTDAVEKQQERLARHAELTEKLNRGMVQGAAQAGLLARGPELEKWTSQQLQSGVTREQAQAAMFGVIRGGPTADLERNQAIAAQMARLAPTMETGQLESTSELAGRLGEFLPGKNPLQIAGLVEGLRTRLGGARSEQLLSRQFLAGTRHMIEQGAATPEEALGLGVSSVLKDISPKMMEQIAARVSMGVEEQKLRRGEAPTAEQRAKSAFNAMTPAERLKAVMSDESVQIAVLGERLAGRTGRISPAEMQAEAARLSAAQQGDAVGRTLQGMRTSEAGRQILKDQEDEVAKDRLSFGKRDEAMMWKEFNEFANIKFGQRGYGPIGRARAESHLAAARAMVAVKSTLPFAEGYTPEHIMGMSGQFSEEEIEEWRQERREIIQAARTQQATNAAAHAKVNGRE